MKKNLQKAKWERGDMVRSCDLGNRGSQREKIVWKCIDTICISFVQSYSNFWKIKVVTGFWAN